MWELLRQNYGTGEEAAAVMRVVVMVILRTD